MLEPGFQTIYVLLETLCSFYNTPAFFVEFFPTTNLLLFTYKAKLK